MSALKGVALETGSLSNIKREPFGAIIFRSATLWVLGSKLNKRFFFKPNHVDRVSCAAGLTLKLCGRVMSVRQGNVYAFVLFIIWVLCGRVMLC